MATIKSGSSQDALTIDTTSKAARLTLYGSTGLEQSYEQKATFGLTVLVGDVGGVLGLASNPTDIIALTGSESKIVKLVSFAVATTNTTAQSLEYYLLKRDTLSTSNSNLGTVVSISLIGCPFDSHNQPTAEVLLWPAGNPTLLGNLVGNINIKRVAAPVTIPTSWAGITRDNTIEMLPAIGPSILDSPVTLRGSSESVVLNLNAVNIVGIGQLLALSIIWTEE